MHLCSWEIGTCPFLFLSCSVFTLFLVLEYCYPHRNSWNMFWAWCSHFWKVINYWLISLIDIDLFRLSFSSCVSCDNLSFKELLGFIQVIKLAGIEFLYYFFIILLKSTWSVVRAPVLFLIFFLFSLPLLCFYCHKLFLFMVCIHFQIAEIVFVLNVFPH